LLAQGTNVYTWDAANRLVSANVDGVVSSFEYDGSGNRTAQTVDGVTTEYVLDVAGGLPEVIVATTSGAITRYVQIQGQVLAQQDSGAWTYILPDHLGSVRQLVGSDSQVDLAQSFDPFGVPFETSGSGVSDFGYTGEWWDSEAGLLYLRARYYEPAVGRLISKDRFPGDFNEPQTLNGWSYVDGNPVNLVDPTGLYSMKEIKGFFYNAPTYLHVLRYFERGGGLEGRWGWLEVLRSAEDGDRILVIEARTSYCAPGDVLFYGRHSLPYPSYVREDLSGIFRSTGGQLMIVGKYPFPSHEHSHFQAALGGYWYHIERNTHTDLYGNYDPMLQGTWARKADILAATKYMGLRHDPALAQTDATGVYADLLKMFAPTTEEELGYALVKFIHEAPSKGLVDAGGEFTQEASRALIISLMELLQPEVGVPIEIADFSVDMNELMKELGFIRAP
jgi:RHS repeat-associated protein